jgi:hypothetical protein
LYFDKLSLWNKEENSGTERIYNAMKKYSQS